MFDFGEAQPEFASKWRPVRTELTGQAGKLIGPVGRALWAVPLFPW